MKKSSIRGKLQFVPSSPAVVALLLATLLVGVGCSPRTTAGVSYEFPEVIVLLSGATPDDVELVEWLELESDSTPYSVSRSSGISFVVKSAEPQRLTINWHATQVRHANDRPIRVVRIERGSQYVEFRFTGRLYTEPTESPVTREASFSPD